MSGRADFRLNFSSIPKDGSDIPSFSNRTCGKEPLHVVLGFIGYLCKTHSELTEVLKTSPHFLNFLQGEIGNPSPAGKKPRFPATCTHCCLFIPMAKIMILKRIQGLKTCLCVVRYLQTCSSRGMEAGKGKHTAGFLQKHFFVRDLVEE